MISGLLAYQRERRESICPFNPASYCSIGLQCFKEAMRLLDILSHVHADSAGRGMLTMGSEGSVSSISSIYPLQVASMLNHTSFLKT